MRGPSLCNVSVLGYLLYNSTVELIHQNFSMSHSISASADMILELEEEEEEEFIFNDTIDEIF
jgi:hypothetical protein